VAASSKSKRAISKALVRQTRVAASGQEGHCFSYLEANQGGSLGPERPKLMRPFFSQEALRQTRVAASSLLEKSHLSLEKALRQTRVQPQAKQLKGH
jgi:hypothetical protein